MIPKIGNIWDYIGKVDIICITTNDFVKKNGEAVMGRGVAKQLLERHPHAAKILGQKIKEQGGGKIYKIVQERTTTILSFPVKPAYVIANDNKTNVVSHAKRLYDVGSKVPGYHSMASLNIIESSCKKLMTLLDYDQTITKVVMPLPGCGAGGLSWWDVEPILMRCGFISDDRIVILYQGELK